VFDLHNVFSPEETRAWAAEGCRTAGIGCIECKTALADRVVARIEPIGKRRRDFESRPDDVRDIFRDGARRASEVAEHTMADVRGAVKLPPPGEI
jgi:tryptophanyl-tRNA synthetase